MLSSKTLQSDYPITFIFGNTTLHLTEQPSVEARQSLEQLINKRRAQKLTRASAPLASGDTPLFAKVQPLDTLKAKVRVTLGKPQRNGRFDWPLEELMNTLEAQRRGVQMPPLQGFGYTRDRLGLTQEYFILTRLLEDYIDGVQWLKRHPEHVETFILKAFELLGSLSRKDITHMDFWIGNIMVPKSTKKPLKAIDFENCFAGSTPHFSETLGFQLGFFYRREIYKFITEADYDRLVDEYLGQFCSLSRNKFDQVYRASKHEHVGRKQRRDVFLNGNLITG
ncbi:lipopolysaccharide kinase InaA family protein [Pseudomonas putida]|uniref:lipopolysaccharide kinase InaA family protein n=1 Tax=Pseudomonas putida TaxID=303 RepID=UPI003D96CF4F